LARLDSATHAARDSSDSAAPAIASISEVTLSTTGSALRSVAAAAARIGGRVDYRQQDQQVGACQWWRHGREAIIVAVADFSLVRTVSFSLMTGTARHSSSLRWSSAR